MQKRYSITRVSFFLLYLAKIIIRISSVERTTRLEDLQKKPQVILQLCFDSFHLPSNQICDIFITNCKIYIT
jgi:hypothetical protein